MSHRLSAGESCLLGIGYGGRCPFSRSGSSVRCASVVEKCTSDADCPAGRACCYHKSACIRSCLPACEPACGYCQWCELRDNGSRAECIPSTPHLPCPYNDLVLRVCPRPRVNDCWSNGQCASGQACCFRGCKWSCLPTCPAPCPSDQRCTLQEELGVSSCKTPLQ